MIWLVTIIDNYKLLYANKEKSWLRIKFIWLGKEVIEKKEINNEI